VFWNLDFKVANAGLWHFRFQLDFGYGGAILVDGKPIVTSGANFDGEFPLRLKSGLHSIKIYGKDDCCSDVNNGWFQPPGGVFTNFALTDGLSLK
jgi:hypothetical protein